MNKRNIDKSNSISNDIGECLSETILIMKKTCQLILYAFILCALVQCKNNTAKTVQGIGPVCYDTVYPVVYNCAHASNGDYAFRTIPAKELRVKLIPNLETRTNLKMKVIPQMIGVHQFFLDHDLVSGFVHPFTKRMYETLKPDEYVLKYTASATDKNIGTIAYISKSKLGINDILGKNIAYFRNWRLSEIDYKINNGLVFIKSKPCNFNKRCACPESNQAGNMKQIPVWHKADSGYLSIEKFNAFGRNDGGTVALIWEVNNEIFFQDIHSSWKEILERAIEISKTYHTDPTIAISDAGPLAQKVRANKKFELTVASMDALAPFGKRYGAGYGYVQGFNK